MQNICVKEHGIMVQGVSGQVVCTTKAGTVCVHTICLETMCTIIPYSFTLMFCLQQPTTCISILSYDAQDTRN